MNEHEIKFVEAFVNANKQARFRELLADQKKRRKITSTLDHTTDLRIDRQTAIPSDKQAPLDIRSFLVNLGAPETCYLISGNPRLDGQVMRLIDALTDVIGYGDGTFVSCIPGILGYFESAEPNGRYIFKKQ